MIDPAGSTGQVAQGTTTQTDQQKTDTQQQQEQQPAPADDKTRLLPPVNSTATRGEKSLVETPANVTVINRQEMDRRMEETINDLIRYQPGVQVNRQTSGTDPFASFGGFNIRGVGGNRVQTLVDGNRTIERITDQTRDFIDLGNMKKVEIVRGPASVLWGSDALGGVVAFTTKDPEDYLAPGKNFGFQYDQTWNSLDNAFTEKATAAARHGIVDVMLSYTRRDAEEVELSKARDRGGEWPCTRDPLYAQGCDKLNPADIESNNLLGKVVFNFSPQHRFKITGEYFNRNTEVDQLNQLGRTVGGTPTAPTYTSHTVTDYERKQELERWRISLDHEWKPMMGWLDEVRWQATYHPQELKRSGERFRALTNGQTDRLRDLLEYSEDFYEGEIQLKSSFGFAGMHHALTYGIDGGYTKGDYYRRDDLTNLTTGVTTTTVAGGFNFANFRTRRLDFYIQDEIDLFNGVVVITPGVRLATYRIKPKTGEGYVGPDPKTLNETDLAAKLGVIVNLNDNYSLYAQYSEGFKMPTAEQLYTSVPAFGLVNNPNLKPESVKSYEAGVRGQFTNGYFSVNVFYADYSDFIQSFVPIPGTTDVTYQNLSKVYIYGIEGQGAWRFLPEWELNAAFSYQHGDQKADSNSPKKPLNGVEPFRLVTGLRWVKEAWGLDVEAVASYQNGVKRTDAGSDSRKQFEPDSYFLLDLIAAWQPYPNVTLRAAVMNVFDKRYFLPAAANYNNYPESAAVANTNPLEAQTQPGRHFLLGASVKF
ncbi:MAG: TonB-dependent hemoglobin/transferrin/lactoferrin family receptor [Reyranellaceae bacterium]